jgi:uncharacterized repeat protein (TIGR01451 family)
MIALLPWKRLLAAGVALAALAPFRPAEAQEAADMVLTLTNGITSVHVGDEVTYVLTVTNAGPSTALAVNVIDNLPAELSDCLTEVQASGGVTGHSTGTFSGSIVEIGLEFPAGASVTYTMTCTVASLGGGVLSNTAALGGSTPDPNVGNNISTDTDTVAPALADLILTLSDGTTTAIVGGTITFVISVTNAGPSTARGVNLVDNFPPELSGCSTEVESTGGVFGHSAGPFTGPIAEGPLVFAPSGSITYTSTCTVASLGEGTLYNTAAVGGSTPDPTSLNNITTDTNTIVEAAADLVVTLTNGTSTVRVGDTVTYLLTMTNGGPSTARGASVIDPFPPELSGCSTTSVAAGGVTGSDPGPFGGAIAETGLELPAGGTITYTTTCTVASAGEGMLSNTATVGGTTFDPSPSNNVSTDGDTIETGSGGGDGGGGGGGGGGGDGGGGGCATGGAAEGVALLLPILAALVRRRRGAR